APGDLRLTLSLWSVATSRTSSSEMIHGAIAISDPSQLDDGWRSRRASTGRRWGSVSRFRQSATSARGNRARNGGLVLGISAPLLGQRPKDSWCQRDRVNWDQLPAGEPVLSIPA